MTLDQDTKFTDVMLDLETTGTAPGSGILQIGAVAFNSGSYGVPEAEWPTFDSGLISRASCRAVGLTEDKATLEWWEVQSEEARARARALVIAASDPEKSRHLAFALWEFGAWRRKTAPDTLIWGNGSDFDNVLLRAAYERAALPCPWSYGKNRCYRTLKRLLPQVPEPEFVGLKHDALADAVHQARHLRALLAALPATEAAP